MINGSASPSMPTSTSSDDSSDELEDPLTNDVAEIRKRLANFLALRGYCAPLEAILLLEDHFCTSNRYKSIGQFTRQLSDVITLDIKPGESVITASLAQDAIARLCNANQQQQVDLDPTSSDVVVINEPEVPLSLPVKIRNVFCEHAEKKILPPWLSRSTDDNVDKKNDFKLHFNFLKKRLESLPIFQGDFHLTNLDELTASRQSSVRCICFGLLVKDVSKIDGYLLIDDTGRVPLRITPETTFRNRLAYSKCIVVVEGVYINPDDVLYAANIGLPPVLLDPIKEKHLSCVDDKTVVILRELYLDDEDICRALDSLFALCNSQQHPPLVFILIGDFTREPQSVETLSKYMKKLVAMIRLCDNLKESHFVLIPGLHDTSPIDPETGKPSGDMPKPPLSGEQIQTQMLQMSGFKNIHLATNPTHVILGDRHIAAISHSYIKQLRDNLLHDLSDHREELFETIKQIILSNRHFAAGITKKYPTSMSLWTRPDLLLLADSEAFGNRYDYSSSSPDDTSFATLPSFSRQLYKFKIYHTKTGKLEDSKALLEGQNSSGPAPMEEAQVIE